MKLSKVAKNNKDGFNMLHNIRIVLVNTSHPGNIGAAARAMKTMGLTELYLVSPVSFPDHKADEMAVGANDILKRAHVVTDLEAAIHDCTLVVGTSARERSVSWPTLSPRQFAEQIPQQFAHERIAILFGREQSGLTNEELQRCQLCLHIPVNPDFSSLNIAAAVQVITYELFAHLQHVEDSKPLEEPLATNEELERFFEHLEQVLLEIDFLKGRPSTKLMIRMRRLFHRARPDIREVNILRGILTSVQEARDQK